MEKRGSISFTIIERSEAKVTSEMPIGPGVKNPYGVVQAGAILWMADVTATVLVLGAETATEGQKGFPLAINLNASFLSNQRDGSLKAVATYVKRGRTVSVVRTTIFGNEDKLIAEVTTSHVLSS
jgi:uncharacterized protein (TIGR00369 family)